MNQYLSNKGTFRFAVIAMLVGMALGFALAYIMTDDKRLEEAEQLTRISRIVQAHYAKECRR